ncbi:unnamed protein product [Musa textilis]
MFRPSLRSASGKCRERHVVIIAHLRYENFIPPNLHVRCRRFAKHMVLSCSIHRKMLWFGYHLDIDLIVCLL